jgi:DNA-binding XRE family transcriptional regulator
MLELTKKQTTKGFVELHFLVPKKKAEEIKKVVACLGGVEEAEENELVPFEDAFPEFHHGITLRGLRQRDGLTQGELAEKIGSQQNHISEMEKGKRAIGKAIAKKLGEVFNTSYRVFL